MTFTLLSRSAYIVLRWAVGVVVVVARGGVGCVGAGYNVF